MIFVIIIPFLSSSYSLRFLDEKPRLFKAARFIVSLVTVLLASLVMPVLIGCHDRISEEGANMCRGLLDACCSLAGEVAKPRESAEVADNLDPLHVVPPRGWYWA